MPRDLTRRSLERVADDAWEIRRLAIECAAAHRTCHIGSSLSLAEILAVAYGRTLDVARGDRLVLSKGHAASALYAAEALHGRIDADTVIRGYCADGGQLAGHPERGMGGAVATTGSLGHGLAIAVGLALADRHDGSERRTLCVLGDGELDEGSVWEAAMLAGHLRLGSLTAVVDANGFQALGSTADVLDLEPLDWKLAAFGWDVLVVDGHDVEELDEALAEEGGRPLCVVARTVKGSGLDIFDGPFRSHYQSFPPEQREAMLASLERARAATRDDLRRAA